MAAHGRDNCSHPADKRDAGGYCNALVLDGNGDGDVCGVKPITFADLLAEPPAPEQSVVDATKTDADLPLPGQVLQTVTDLYTYEAQSDRFETSDVTRAQVTTSMVDYGPRARESGRQTPTKWERHKVVLDIDLPAKLVPSSTPGHAHLYIDHEMSWEHYAAILLALGNAGILEEGYVNASLARKHTAVRLPWVRKPQPEPVEERKTV